MYIKTTDLSKLLEILKFRGTEINSFDKVCQRAKKLKTCELSVNPHAHDCALICLDSLDYLPETWLFRCTRIGVRLTELSRASGYAAETIHRMRHRIKNKKEDKKNDSYISFEKIIKIEETLSKLESEIHEVKFMDFVLSFFWKENNYKKKQEIFQILGISESYCYVVAKSRSRRFYKVFNFFFEEFFREGRECKNQKFIFPECEILEGNP